MSSPPGVLGHHSALRIVILSQVTHHSAIFPPSTRNTAPKSNVAFRPEGGNEPMGPSCVPSYVVHAATRSPSADGIGKDKRILPKEFLDLRLDAWCRLAVADEARRNQIIERVGLTAVPRVKETPDHGLVLLDRCTHGEGTSL